MSGKLRDTRWTKLALRLRREWPACQIRLPGCTGWTEEIDHILPVSQYPSLKYEITNLRAACRFCNNTRGVRPDAELPITSQPSKDW